MTKKLQEIVSLFPQNKGDKIDWCALEKTTLSPVFQKMKETKQNPEYHGEGNVFMHTELVCNALVTLEEYWLLSKKEREILLLSALLHDIGKTKCTRLIDGVLSSPHHAKTGAIMARELLWRDYGLCGSEELQNIRESVCAFIKYHSYPPFAILNNKPEFKMIKVASQGKLVTYFSIEKLCMLEKADVLGRISNDSCDYLERIECCAMLADELNCKNKPYEFFDEYTARGYLKSGNIPLGYNAFNDTWGEVILMSGLPGTGKDTYIEKNYPNMPVVSLDNIRLDLKISPVGNQGEVVAEGKRQAREYLRKKQSFIWNATNVTEQIRTGLTELFESYGARVKIVFLETEWQEQLRRNSSRKAQVPLEAIERMLSKLEIPEAFEAQSVVWQIT